MENRLSGEHRNILNEIPVVDLADFHSTDAGRRDAFVERVAEGFQDIGFIFVRTPHISPMLPKVYETYKKLFDLPLEAKMGYERPDLHHQRGYTPSFSEIGIYCQKSGPGVPEDHAMVQRFPSLYAPNIWPKEVPEFREMSTALYQELFGLGTSLLDALEVYLGYEKGFFDDVVRESPTVLRPLHYPAVQEYQLDKIVWGCQHTDINFLTVLPASTKKGLWVQTRSGEWVPGMAPPDCSLVQVGDMLQYMTGGYFLSAQHKVDAPTEPTTEGRYSSALFIHARSNFTFQVDRRLAENPAQFPEITAESYLYKRLQEIGLAKKQAGGK
jgi:isopenicillin N synthase-like dioxygenase